METLLFALFAFFIAGIPTEYGAEMYAVAIADGGSPPEMAAVVYSEHRKSRDYDPPYGESTHGAVGMYQMVNTWRYWSNEEFGWDHSAEDFAQDPYIAIKVASKLLLRIEERHAKHPDAGHYETSHWKCGEKGRALLDEGKDDEAPRCKSASVHLIEDIERFEESWENTKKWFWFLLLPYGDGVEEAQVYSTE